MVDVVFGALCDDIATQLAKQDCTVTDEAELARIQLIANAVSVVTIHQLITPSQSDKARTKLSKRLWKIVALPAPDTQP